MADKNLNREEKVDNLVNTSRSQDPWDAYFNGANQQAASQGKKKKRKKSKNVFLAPSVMMFVICGLAIAICLVALLITSYRISKAEEAALPSPTMQGEPTPSPTPFPTPVPIDGPESFETLSAELCTLTKTDTEWCKKEEDPSNDGLYFIPDDNNKEVLVYHTDSASLCDGSYALQDFSYMWINSENNGFYAVINIAGTKVDFSNYYILVRDEQGLYASRVIINCYEADQVILTNTIVNGTILAPNARIYCSNTFLCGQLIGKSYEGNLRYKRDVVFTGYAEVMGTTHGVEFQNKDIRKRVIEALKKTDPKKYSNYGMNSDLLEKDIKRIFELDLSNLELKDFGTDLDLFSHLISLNVSGNPLLRLDLTNFPNLQALYAAEIPAKELDLSPCGALRILDIGGVRFNGLPDFSKTPKLEYLRVSNTGISSIDYDKLKNLKKLDISENTELKEFSIKSLPLLEQLDISNCSLTSLSFSGAENLRYIKASGNFYTTISLNEAPKLTYVEMYTEPLTVIFAKDFFKHTNGTIYHLDSTRIDK